MTRKWGIAKRIVAEINLSTSLINLVELIALKEIVDKIKYYDRTV